jgi:Cache domain
MAKIFSLIISVIVMFFSLTARAESKSAFLKLDPLVTLGTYKGLVEDHLGGVLRTARVIALTSEAGSAKWESVKPMLDRFSNDLATDATVWYALPDGSYFSTETGGVSDQNLKDRNYFPKLMSGQDVFGDLVISKSTGHRSIIVATPVMVNGKVVASVGVSVRVRLLSALLDSDTKLPDNAYFYALDPENRIVLHRNVDRMFKSVSDVGDESLGDAFKTIMTKDQGVFNYTLHGKKITSIFMKSTTLGWYFFIAQERK